MAFNIRVYGILINSDQEVLLSDERFMEREFTKFPGGGLIQGEGLKDCLIREFKEELGIDIQVGEVFYITDFYVKSAFHEDDQIISIYYKVSTTQIDQIEAVKKPFEFNTNTPKMEVFRWKNKHELTSSDFTFPIDKVVAELIAKS